MPTGLIRGWGLACFVCLACVPAAWCQDWAESFEQGLAGVAYKNESELLQAIAPVGWVLVFCALCEWLLARRLPEIRPGLRDGEPGVPHPAAVAVPLRRTA